MTLTIDRKTWLRGEGSSNSFLLRPKDDKKCCLGFFCASKGYRKKQMVGVKYPNQLAAAPKKLPELVDVSLKNTSVITKLVCDNDNSLMAEEEREKRIAAHFLTIGVKVEFVN